MNELTPPHIDWSVSGDIVNSDFLSTRRLRLPKHSIALSENTRRWGLLPLNFKFFFDSNDVKFTQPVLKELGQVLHLVKNKSFEGRRHFFRANGHARREEEGVRRGKNHRR